MGLLYLKDLARKQIVDKYSGGLGAGAPSLMQHLPEVAATNPVEFHWGRAVLVSEAVASAGYPEGKRLQGPRSGPQE
jgi:hypothetical protein